jgi:hypothetical protein
MGATSRIKAVASGRAPSEKSPRAVELEVNSGPYVNHDAGWLRTGAHRLAPIPLSLREWHGPENRSKFGENENRPHDARGSRR